MSNVKSNIQLKFLGKKTIKYLIYSSIIGIFWFAIESSFLLVLQGFLFSLGIIEGGKVILPYWYPRGIVLSLFIVVGYGVFRAIAFMLKLYFSHLVQSSFLINQRSLIFKEALLNRNSLPMKDVMSYFGDVSTQAGMLMYYVGLLFPTLIAALCFFCAGVVIAPVEMLIGVLCMALTIIPLKIFNKKISNLGQSVTGSWISLNGALLTSLKNHFFLNLFNLVRKEIRSTEDGLDKYRREYSLFALYTGLTTSLPMMVGVIIVAFISYISVFYLKTEALKLVAFFYIFIRLAQALSEINNNIAFLKMYHPAYSLLFTKYKESFHTLQNDDHEPLVVSELKSIYVDKISKSINKKVLFENLSFSLKQGDLLLIKGESGSGKSSLLNIILGLDIPEVGKVVINDHTVDKQRITLYKVLGYVGPEAYLINGTLLENLEYGIYKNINLELLNYYIDKLELRELINHLPDGINTIMSDNLPMSTGQKQRLSIIRALVRNPSVLVLDESTANLDKVLEKRVVDLINNIKHEMITVVVSHGDAFDKVANLKIDFDSKDKEIVTLC